MQVLMLIISGCCRALDYDLYGTNVFFSPINLDAEETTVYSCYNVSDKTTARFICYTRLNLTING